MHSYVVNVLDHISPSVMLIMCHPSLVLLNYGLEFLKAYPDPENIKADSFDKRVRLANPRRCQMNVFDEQELDRKFSENVWHPIAADLAPVTNAAGVRMQNFEDMDGEENLVRELNADTVTSEVPERILDLDRSELPDRRHMDMSIAKDQGSLSADHVPITGNRPIIQEPSSSPLVSDHVKREMDAENLHTSEPTVGLKSSMDVRAQLFSDSTDEDLESDDGEKQVKREDNVLGKRSRSPEPSVAQISGKKSKGYGDNESSAPSAGTPGGGEGYASNAVKVEDQRHIAERMESQGASFYIPPGLEKLHRVYTSLNTACGFLQNQQLESSWPNVRQALKQLSGSDEVVSFEDVHRLAQLCPRFVVLSKLNGEGEDAMLHIELCDPSEPRNSEQTGRQVSDTEARVIVERRQQAFQLSLAQLAQQLQVSQGNVEASEHGNHSPTPAMQRHAGNDGYHPVGPAILALPTQNLVLTPPPFLPQQMQPNFIDISNGYHGLPFPIQVQPFTFPQQQASNYAGYQLSSIPSTSQPSPLHPHKGLHVPQPIPPSGVDLAEPASNPEGSSFHSSQSLNKAKRKRARNWDTWEAMHLVQAKCSEIASGRERFDSSVERWKKVERYLKENKVVDRDAAACKHKWESLLSEYKAVKDWNRKPGQPPYHLLTSGEKKAASLPPIFASNLMDLMESFQGKSAHVSPPSVGHSQGRSAPVISGGAASAGDGNGAEDSGEDGPSVPHGAGEGLGKRTIPDEGLGPVVAALDRMTASLVSIEKGRDEKSERLLELETRKYELERNKFELQARKLEIEREDRKALQRVLGNLAGAFHRIADKMDSK